jgi:hypothetical protein
VLCPSSALDTNCSPPVLLESLLNPLKLSSQPISIKQGNHAPNPTPSPCVVLFEQLPIWLWSLRKCNWRKIYMFEGGRNLLCVLPVHAETLSGPHFCSIQPVRKKSLMLTFASSVDVKHFWNNHIPAWMYYHHCCGGLNVLGKREHHQAVVLALTSSSWWSIYGVWVLWRDWA